MLSEQTVMDTCTKYKIKWFFKAKEVTNLLINIYQDTDPFDQMYMIKIHLWIRNRDLSLMKIPVSTLNLLVASLATVLFTQRKDYDKC